jgi:hypothetical protein
VGGLPRDRISGHPPVDRCLRAEECRQAPEQSLTIVATAGILADRIEANPTFMRAVRSKPIRKLLSKARSSSQNRLRSGPGRRRSPRSRETPFASKASGPTSGCGLRTARGSDRQAPPSASISARSRTTRPGSCLRAAGGSAIAQAVSPSRSAASASNGTPACDTAPSPSDATSTGEPAPIALHPQVILTKPDSRAVITRNSRSPDSTAAPTIGAAGTSLNDPG